MKKLFLLLMFLFVLCSCNKDEDNSLEVSSTFTREKLTINDSLNTYITIDLDTLNNKINNNDFIILVIGKDGCGSCEYYQTTLNQAINKYHMEIFYINIDESNQASLKEMFNYTQTPTTYIIQDGKIIATEEGVLSYSEFVGFKNNTYKVVGFLPKYCYKEEYIDVDTLDSKITNEDDFTYIFVLEGCSDCEKLFEIINEENTIYLMNIYCVEVTNYRSNGITSMDWVDFSTKYNFNSYRGGRVPVLINDDKKMIFLNDEITYTTSYTITNSFFSELINIKNFDSLDECILYSYNYHKNMLKTFLYENVL